MSTTRKKKSAKRFIIPAVIVLLIGGFIAYRVLGKKEASLPSVALSTVMKTNIENSINVDGIVESDVTEMVMPKSALRVLENKVEKGDIVKEGDVLCILDSKDLENSIEQQQSTMNVSAANNNQSVANAQNQYNKASSNVANEKDSAIAQAQLGVTTAKQRVTQAEQALRQSESAVDTAGLDFRSAQDNVRDKRAEAQWDGYELQDFQTNSLVNSREAAYLRYEQAKAAVGDAKQGILDAKQGVLDAENSLAIAKNSVGQQIDGLADSVASAKVAANSTQPQEIAIAHLQESLEDTTVRAPISGTVTEVYVKEGVAPTGIMYIIEDVNNLKVVAVVKEYSLVNISEGTPAQISSELSGDDLYDGAVKNISPTSIKNAQGATANPADPEFQLEINIPKNDTLLRIGTKARVDLIYEQKENVLAIPVNALASNAAGEDVVFVLKEEHEGVYKVVAVPVTTGIESDSVIEILSGEIAEGDGIVALTQGIVEDMLVKITEGGAPAAGAGQAPGGITMGMAIGKKSVAGLDAK